MEQDSPRSDYLDHAATSFPKAPGVGRAMLAALDYGNPGRAAHRYATAADELTSRVRQRVAEEFGVLEHGAVIFTSGATMSLNLAVKGVLQPGDHIVTTSFEHNSVLRPLKAMERLGCSLSVVQSADPGKLVGLVAREIRPSTRMVAVTHASNVTGALLPVREIAELAHRRNALVLVDSAQSVGHLRFQVDEIGADLLAFGAHKGLRGPTGIGVLIVANRSFVDLEPLVNGGTGLYSDELIPPIQFPGSFEAGTPNLPALAGLEAALSYLAQPESKDMQRLGRGFSRGCVLKLLATRGVTVFPPGDFSPIPMFSFAVPGRDPSRIAETLDRQYGLQVRGGLHCAPLMHQSLGTAPLGTVRVSFGPGNTNETASRLCDAIREITKGAME